MPLTELRKWSTTILKAQSANSQLQTPAGARIDVYRRGATVSVLKQVTGSGAVSTVSVYDVGSLRVNDAVQLSLTPINTATVTAINSTTSVDLRNDGATFTAEKYDRLIITTSRPTLYKDISGVQTTANGASSYFDTDSNGYAEFYVVERGFDYIAAGSGFISGIFTDQNSGPEENEINVRRFASIQDAVNYTAARLSVSSDTGLAVIPQGRVRVPAGTYSPTSTPSFTGITLPADISLVGDGRELSVLYLPAGYENTDFIVANYGDNRLEGLQCLGANIVGSGRGFVAINASQSINNTKLRDVSFTKMPSWCMEIRGAPFTDQLLFENVVCGYAKSGGSLRLGASTAVGDAFTSSCDSIVFIKCEFNGPGYGTYGSSGDVLQMGGVHITQANDIQFLGCDFQPLNGTTALSIASVSRNLSFYGGHFENAGTGGAGHWITIGATGGVSNLNFNGLGFYRNDTTKSVQLIKVGDHGSLLTANFDKCFFFSSKTGAAATDDIELGLGTTSLSDIQLTGCVYSTPSITPPIPTMIPIAHPTAKSMWFGTDYRMKLAALTDADIDGATLRSAPQKGEIVYSTTSNQLRFYNGTSWKTITGYV